MAFHLYSKWSNAKYTVFFPKYPAFKICTHVNGTGKYKKIDILYNIVYILSKVKGRILFAKRPSILVTRHWELNEIFERPWTIIILPRTITYFIYKRSINFKAKIVSFQGPLFDFCLNHEVIQSSIHFVTPQVWLRDSGFPEPAFRCGRGDRRKQLLLVFYVHALIFVLSFFLL